MQKNELKSLAQEMYDNLLNSIDEQEEATIKQLVTYLKDATKIISGVDDNDVSSLEEAKATFHNAYKDIAHESISSYENTNEKFEKLSQMQKETLQECYSDQKIDLPTLTTKFNEIQTHMTDEIQKANNIITQLSEQVKSLEAKSNLDSLTKVFNRRALTSYLQNICSKDGVPYELHLLMLDIDDFKNINDKYGHIAGDKVLIFIANILKKTLRDGDKIFRYGGEEFIIVLNRIDSELCLKITNRLLDLVRKNKLIYKGESLKVTISIGSTKYAIGDTPDMIVTRADKALYKAKNNGKNQMYAEVK